MIVVLVLVINTNHNICSIKYSYYRNHKIVVVVSLSSLRIVKEVVMALRIGLVFILVLIESC